MAIRQCLGYQQITNCSSSVGFTVPSGANRAHVECDSAAGQSVRWRADGTAPTTAVGTELLPGSDFLFDSDLTTINFLEMAASAKLNVHYFA
jgi:hypothetical protein